jgi:hypothetical protein
LDKEKGVEEIQRRGNSNARILLANSRTPHFCVRIGHDTSEIQHDSGSFANSIRYFATIPSGVHSQGDAAGAVGRAAARARRHRIRR